MAFNEQNTVEHFIIHQLTGVNLNAGQYFPPEAIITAKPGNPKEYREPHERFLMRGFLRGPRILFYLLAVILMKPK